MTATAPPPRPADVDRLYRQLFSNVLVANDLVAWYRELTYRASVIQAVLDLAQTQRAQTVAHMADTLGMSHRKICAELGDLNVSRVGQLVKKGRRNIRPLNRADFESPKEETS